MGKLRRDIQSSINTSTRTVHGKTTFDLPSSGTCTCTPLSPRTGQRANPCTFGPEFFPSSKPPPISSIATIFPWTCSARKRTQAYGKSFTSSANFNLGDWAAAEGLLLFYSPPSFPLPFYPKRGSRPLQPTTRVYRSYSSPYVSC